eukprot:gnl/Chilomastix_caulleri/6025.p1 GENE.gnl/Chilomastix_caulleri/6025~~gnl/Chilomastix_caulleri/6025.p1  ORF type:complete len:73 (-),score=6.47 gnl/Chilomastix_caulleri/6025:70-288(-)
METKPQFLHCPDVVKWPNLNQMCVIPRDKDVIILGGQCGYDINEKLAEGIGRTNKTDFREHQKVNLSLEVHQ